MEAAKSRGEITGARTLTKPAIDLLVHDRIETATFALGWFWGPDARFGVLKGVIRTRVGYAGGSKKNPTYHSLGDHTETIQIDYDPNQITYQGLLDIFWENHDPTHPAWSRQYMAVIFYHNEEQKRLATESREREASRQKKKVYTEILPAGGFYLAEDYHQKYRLRGDREFTREFGAIYQGGSDFVNSTAVARVNGYLDGYGTLRDLEPELNSLGLSPTSGEKLLDIVKKREKMGPRC